MPDLGWALKTSLPTEKRLAEPIGESSDGEGMQGNSHHLGHKETLPYDHIHPPTALQLCRTGNSQFPFIHLLSILNHPGSLLD